VFNRQKDVPIKKVSTKPIVKEVLEGEGAHTDELSIYFVTFEEICRLHADFFNDPSPTDCISLPLDDQDSLGYHVMGEIFICPAAAQAYDPDNLYQEITLYLVHGLLHLLGYDDMQPGDRKKMRAAEKRLMKTLSDKKLLLKAY
jgi:probable rRNA maturation factor